MEMRDWELEALRALVWLRKNTICRLGFHGSSTGFYAEPINFCRYGCGHAFNPDAFKRWVVTLRDGHAVVVSAVNEVHARNLVVYEQPLRFMFSEDGGHTILSSVKVHPQNIASVRLEKPAGRD